MRRSPSAVLVYAPDPSRRAQINRKAAIGLLLLAVSACNSPVDETREPLPQGTPHQFFLVADPEIYEPDRHPGNLTFVLTAPDSTAHRNWWPTRLLLETDRGFSREVLVPPYVCLEPSDRPFPFPLNFEWWTCDRVNVYNSHGLSAEQIDEISTVTGGRLMFFHEFSFGAFHYDFAVGVGRPAIQEALDRMQDLEYLDSVFHPGHEPPCVTSDVVPPPPCPPWSLVTRLPYSFLETSGDTLPVSAGGWVRATYTEPNARQRTTTFHF